MPEKITESSAEPLAQGDEPIVLSLRERVIIDAPGYLLSAGLIIAFVIEEIRHGGMIGWAVSRQALHHGQYATIFTHMFAHGGVAHLLMNLSALLVLSRTFVWGAGGWPLGWLRWALLYVLSALAGCFLYLLIRPDNGVPMLGASGAIFGLWGAVARLGDDPGTIVPMRTRQVWEVVRAAATINVILFSLIYLLNWLLGGQGGLAWEAHVGGFLFGLFAAPWFFRTKAPR